MDHVSAEPPANSGLETLSDAQLAEGMSHLHYVLSDLRTVWNHFPPGVMAALYHRYETRYREFHIESARRTGASLPAEYAIPALPAAAAIATPVSAASPLPAVAMPTAVPIAPSPPTPWFREFVTDHAILLLSYLGGLALIAATILFELYSGDQFGGVVRLGVVTGVTVAFGICGLLCLNRPRLRIVGRSYLLVFALMAPLCCGAAYRFLDLHDRGIPPHVAILIAALYSAVLYAALAQAVRSAGYMLLCIGAAAVAVTAAFVASLASPWLGVPAAAVSVVAVLAARGVRGRATLGAWSEPAAIGAHALALVGVAVTAISPLDAGTLVGAPHLSIALAAVTATYVLAGFTFGQAASLLLAAATLGATVISWVTAAQVSNDASALLLTGVAVVEVAAGLAVRRGAATEAVRRSATPVLITGCAWLLIAAAIPVSDGVAVAVIGAAAVAGAAIALARRSSPWAAGGAAAAVVQLWVHTGSAAAGWPFLPYLTYSGALITAVLALTAWRMRRVEIAAGAAVAASLTTILGVHSANLDSTEYLAALTLWGGILGLAPHLLRNTRDAAGARILAFIHLGVGALVVGGPVTTVALLLAAGTIIAAAITADSREPRLLVGTVVLGTWTWYWIGAAIAPATAQPGASLLAEWYIPLGLVAGATLLLADVWMSDSAGPWSRAIGFVAVCEAGLIALMSALAGGALPGWVLIVVALFAYTHAALTGRDATVPLAVAVAALGIDILLSTRNAAATLYPVAFALLGGAVPAGIALHDGAAWRRRHEDTALGATAVTALLATLAFGGLTTPRTTGPLAGGFSWAMCAAIAVVVGRSRPAPRLRWAGYGTAGFTLVWLDILVGWTSVQGHVLIPAATLIAVSLGMREDSARPAPPETTRLICLGGLALMLGSAALQGLGGGPDTATYITLVLAESVALIGVSIAARDRTVLTAACAGGGVATLEALGNVLPGVPLYVVFAVTAVLLLGLATALAAARTQVGETREQVRATLRTWR